MNEKKGKAFLSCTVPSKIIGDLLIYTYADAPYYKFVAPFILFASVFNDKSHIEVILDDKNVFLQRYGHQITMLQNLDIPFTLSQSDYHDKDIMPNSIRFIQHPKNCAKYVYITDIDILILTDIIYLHVPEMQKYNMFYSNIVRPNDKTKMSGLHFIEYDQYYPVEESNIDLKINDEQLLLKIMEARHPNKINYSYLYRPCPGFHLSLNRMSTRYGKNASWEIKTNNQYVDNFIKVIRDYKYSSCVMQFDLEIRHLFVIIEYIIFGKTDIMTIYSIVYGLDRNCIPISPREIDDSPIIDLPIAENNFFNQPFDSNNLNNFLISSYQNGDFNRANIFASAYEYCMAHRAIYYQFLNNKNEDISKKEDADCETIFRHIYLNNSWGSKQTKSGPGSELPRTKELRKCLPELFYKFNIHTLIDAGCGDMNWMKEVLSTYQMKYIGIDIVKQLIEDNINNFANANTNFVWGDICTMELPGGDSIFLRNVFSHFSFHLVKKFIINFLRADCKYLVTDTWRNNRFRNKDITTGSWHPIDLTLPPFSFPTPLAYIRDDHVKYICIWSKESLSRLNFL